MPISGSFIRGNQSGRFFAPRAVKNMVAESSSLVGLSFIKNRGGESSSIGIIGAYVAIQQRGSYGYGRGISYNADNSNIDSGGTSTRQMQIGVGKNTTEGSPTAPSLQLDYPGMWRFRWVVKGSMKTVSVQANQNSTGSNRPSMVVKANPDVGLFFDISASAADGTGWATIGPLSVTPTGTGSLWVELWNNNTYYPTIGYPDGTVLRPALFDRIITT